MTITYHDPFGKPFKMNWLRMLLTWNGGILQMFWLELIWVLIVGAAFISVYGRLKDPDSNGWKTFEQMVELLKTRFQAALGLMLGFYTGTIYERWWKVRNCAGTSAGCIYNISLMIAAYIPDEPINEEHLEHERHARETIGMTPVQIRHTILRWLNLSHAIVVGDVFEKKRNMFSSFEKLHSLGYCSSEEIRLLSSESSLFVAPLVWTSELINRLRLIESYGITDTMVRMVTDQICTLRGNLGSLYWYKSIPIPLAYRQLVTMCVRGYMMFVLLTLGAVLSDKKIEAYNYWALLPFIFEYFLFVGWLLIADSLGNPYRDWADEFGWEEAVTGTTESTMTIISNLHNSCPTLGQNLRYFEEFGVNTLQADIFRENLTKTQESMKKGHNRFRSLERTVLGI